MQALCVDAYAPIVSILNDQAEGGSPSPEELQAALQCSLRLTGNVFARLTQERRRKALCAIHKDLGHMAEEEFDSSKMLFGESVVERVKKRHDALKTLRAAKQPFRKGGVQKGHSGRRENPVQGQVPAQEANIPQRAERTSWQKKLEPPPTKRFASAPPSEGVGGEEGFKDEIEARPSEGPSISEDWQSQSQRPPNLCGPCQVPFPPVILPRPILAGRLLFFYQNWEKLTQDPWVLETVKGFRITFSQTPFQSAEPSMRVSKEEEAYIEGEVQSLLRKGAIVVTPAHRERECFLSTIFTVPKKGGERRPIINLKSLNKFVPHCHFKMEGIQSLRDIVLQSWT